MLVNKCFMFFIVGCLVGSIAMFGFQWLSVQRFAIVQARQQGTIEAIEKLAPDCLAAFKVKEQRSATK